MHFGLKRSAADFLTFCMP